MALAHVLGVPRIGPNRELKFAQESFWRDEIDDATLNAVASGIRQANWQRQHAAGLEFVTVGDFAFYDQMLNHIALLGCAPARFGFGDKISLSEYFQLARGNAACHAMEMTKWFDTNYHYLVPELKPDTQFSLGVEWLFDEVAEAQTAGFNAKPVLIGPLLLKNYLTGTGFAVICPFRPTDSPNDAGPINLNSESIMPSISSSQAARCDSELPAIVLKVRRRTLFTPQN